MSSRSNCRPGDSPTPAPGSASSSSRRRPRRSKRSSATPARCTSSPAAAPPWPSTCCGISRRVWPACRRPRLAAKYGVRIGAINPNVFQDQIYKYGSLGNPDAEVAATALRPSARLHRNRAVRQPRYLACGSPTVPTTRARPTSANGAPGSRRPCGRSTTVWRRASACSSSTSPSSRPSITPTSPTGAWRSCWRALRARRRRCWSTPATTTRPRTSSRSSPGC